MTAPAGGAPPEEVLLGFAAALRAAGLGVTGDRSQTFLRAVARVGLGDRRATYWAGRATLCAGPEDFETFDAVFSAWFAGGGQEPGPAARTGMSVLAERARLGDGGAGDGDAHEPVAASDAEVLRHRDVAGLDEAERARLAALFGLIAPHPPRRVSYRRRPSRRGVVDPRRTLRLALARNGEPVRIAWRRRSTRPRRTVLLVDVSGSMSGYADALLRLAHRISHGPGPTEVFSVGTRVTRLTAALRDRDPERALEAAGRTVPDWSGGTRLGESLQVFLDRWGQRGLARGSVVVVFSDGWERGDAALLGEQMQRLHRLAHRVVWVNPHKGATGFEPVQQGMAAALPHVDALVAGHSLGAFEEVVRVVADA